MLPKLCYYNLYTVSAQYQIEGATCAAISASIEQGVRTGALPAGATLPAVRALAARLGVAPGTVARAYLGLRQRGVVETAGRHGTRVRPRPALAGARGAGQPPVPPGVRDLSSGEPDRALLPDPAPHLRAVADQAGEPVRYGDGGPLPELVALARARLAADGVPVADADLVVTSGALDGIERLLTSHLRPGDAVAVEDPGWANALDLLAALGLRPVPVPVDRAGPTEAGLRRALATGARAAIITTRAHNPTGAAVDADRAAALRGVLRRHPDTLLIEDDHAAELAAVPLHSLAGATTAWAFLRSVAKPYGPDLRLAVLAGDPATVARVAGRLRLGAGWVSTVLQRLVVSLWRDEAVAAGVAVARAAYAARWTALRDALAAHGIAVPAGTGINLWVPVPDETWAVTALRDAGWAVAPGAQYRLAAPPGIRITVGHLDPAEAAALAAAVRTATRPQPGPRAA